LTLKLPIDAVITWVNGNDEAWLQKKSEFPGFSQWELYHSDTEINDPRFRDFGLLKYTIDSILKYAPWIRNVFVVTMQQKLNFEYSDPRVKVVYHEEFIPAQYLPTFNSNTIELNLHRIPGLSEHFILFNDDMLLNSPVIPEDFFVGDLPKDVFGFKPVVPVYGSIGSIDINNVAIINKHFPKHRYLHANLKNLFNIHYGFSTILQTILCLPWKQYIGFKSFHVPIAHRKADFKKIWSLEGSLLDTTCRSRYRSGNDISHWVIRYFRLVTGQLLPESPRTFKYYDLANIELQDLQQDLLSETHSLICINDTPNVDIKTVVPKVASLLADKYGQVQFK